MHVLPASIIGLAFWIGTMAAVPSLYTVIAGPLIVSGTVLALAML